MQPVKLKSPTAEAFDRCAHAREVEEFVARLERAFQDPKREALRIVGPEGASRVLTRAQAHWLIAHYRARTARNPIRRLLARVRARRLREILAGAKP